MQRKVFLWSLVLTLLVGLGAFASLLRKGTANSTTRLLKQGQFTISVTPVGPTQEMMDEAVNAINADPLGQKYLAGNRVRQLSFEVLDPLPRSLAGPRFSVTFYDYTNNQHIVAEGTFGTTRGITFSTPDWQPLPSEEEFFAASEIVKRSALFSAAARRGALRFYRPMPPLLAEDLGVKAERTLNVGFHSSDANLPGQIVSVNMIRGTVQTHASYAPPTSLATPTACGPPGAGQATTPRNTAGQFDVVVSAGATEIWRMTAVRPSVSSGTRASGVELRNVLYRGKTLFKRAHAPILNVLYDGNACGPYRDWQWQEGMFAATGTDVATGFRLCTTPPQTMLDNGTDTGNFRGVALYQDGNEVVLVSELEAGWYRYITRWHFGLDGTVRPEFGFDGVDNSCVCNLHHHHVYWRFDIDVAEAGKNRITQYDTAFFGTPVLVEGKAFRDYERNRHWMIENVNTGDAFNLFAGDADATAAGDTYAKYDLVFLRFKSGATNLTNEYDDGVNTTGPSNTQANLDQFITGESLDGQDVVIWYGAHFDHLVGQRKDGELPEGSHSVGPTFTPVRW
ncbi:MAG: hypothetical protein HYR56_10815 [Acidobacteria bacterium]|nr:hypothetical protein [Acidobacteriota bacterium]MBI3424946.1 hypothetical protein [Acidobacteriota bacterium]